MPAVFDAANGPLAESAFQNAYLFNGRRFDSDTGLYYYRTRYMNPEIGRFISRDTIGLWGDANNLGNPYTYLGNNPWSGLDPFGEFSLNPMDGVRWTRDKIAVWGDSLFLGEGSEQYTPQRGEEGYVPRLEDYESEHAYHTDRLRVLGPQARGTHEYNEYLSGAQIWSAAKAQAALEIRNGAVVQVKTLVVQGITYGVLRTAQGAYRYYKIPRGAKAVRPNGQKGKYAKRTDVTRHSAEDTNATFPAHYNPPYKPKTQVFEFTTIVDDVYVRLHGKDNMARSWLMKREAVAGLTPAQLKAKYSLPDLPTHLSDVHVPAGTRVRTGKINPLPQYGGIGTATQYQLLDDLPDSAYRGTVEFGR
ncbi:MAG: RHS repeat-associated core domain-containing protein [Candidatus Hydrogenedentes bacterium]|nr:RHS repeat-associated core domain-containing protein [Candidatus Hydrogenedentota bacterium]